MINSLYGKKKRSSLGHSLLELYYLLHSIAVLPTSNQCWTIQSIKGISIVIETIQLFMDKFKQD